MLTKKKGASSGNQQKGSQKQPLELLTIGITEDAKEEERSSSTRSRGVKSLYSTDKKNLSSGTERDSVSAKEAVKRRGRLSHIRTRIRTLTLIFILVAESPIELTAPMEAA